MTAGEIPLSMATTGKPLRVVRIDAGAHLTHRLADLGLTPGVELRRVDGSEAWSATAMLHDRGFGGFFGGWWNRGRGRWGGPGARNRGGRGSGFFGRWPRRGGGRGAPHAAPDRRPGGFRGRGPRGSDGAVVVDLRGSKYVLGYGVGGKIIVCEDQEEAGPRLGK